MCLFWKYQNESQKVCNNYYQVFLLHQVDFIISEWYCRIALAPYYSNDWNKNRSYLIRLKLFVFDSVQLADIAELISWVHFQTYHCIEHLTPIVSITIRTFSISVRINQLANHQCIWWIHFHSHTHNCTEHLNNCFNHYLIIFGLFVFFYSCENQLAD